MNAWHKARWQWQTADEEEVAVVVEDRLPDWGLTRLGRRIAARALAERNVAVEEVADLIGVDPRTVYRWRAEDRRQQGVAGLSAPVRPVHGAGSCGAGGVRGGGRRLAG